MQPYNCRHKSVLCAALILIISLAWFFLLFPVAVSASAGSGYLQTEPTRLVMQVIDNQFYKWYEYESGEDNLSLIYQIEPFQKRLTTEEAVLLLQASRKWENYYLVRPSSIAIDTETNLRLEGLSDNRIVVSQNSATTYPCNTVGYLSIYFPSEFMRGTGFLVSPYTVLTNAHNVYTPGFGGWFDSIKFSPGQYETQWPNVVKPYSSLSPVLAETNDNYLYHANNGDINNSIKYDYAALFFDEAFSGISTFIPLEFNYSPSQVFLLGYPGVVRGNESLGMWRSEGAIITRDDHSLYYAAYTSGGNSGSPVLVYNLQADTYRVVAIHSFSFAGDDNFGGGPHLNSKNQQIIEKWLRWVPETVTTEIPDPVPVAVDAVNPVTIPDPSNSSPGDLNSDGIINILDAVLALQHILLLTEIDEELRSLIDVNQDDQLNIIDVTLIMQYSLGIISTFN